MLTKKMLFQAIAWNINEFGMFRVNHHFHDSINGYKFSFGQMRPQACRPCIKCLLLLLLLVLSKSSVVLIQGNSRQQCLNMFQALGFFQKPLYFQLPMTTWILEALKIRSRY